MPFSNNSILSLSAFIISNLTKLSSGIEYLIIVTGLNGLAEFSYDCGPLVFTPLPGLGLVTEVAFEVVDRVIFPERQIQLEEARQINPEITRGEIMAIPLRIESSARADVIRAKEDLLGSVMISKGDVRVRFHDLAFSSSGTVTKGNVINGIATVVY